MRSAIALVLLVFVLGDVTSSQGTNPGREPATLIVEGIRLLERKDYGTFIKTFARPDVLAEMLEKKTMAEVAADFENRRAAGTLAALKEAATLTPTMNADGTRARYAFSKPIDGDRSLTLEKIGNSWFIR